VRRAAIVRNALAFALALAACERPTSPTELGGPVAAQASGQATSRINLVLDRVPTAAMLSELAAYGNVIERIDAIRALTIQAPASATAQLAALPYVDAAGPDAERQGSPVDPVALSDFTSGINTWNLDAVNVTNFGVAGRTVPYDGTGVYVGVLDTGLLDTWRQYFPEQRIATDLAIAFSGGGQDQGNVSTPTNQWEHDANSHGTHVTSTILGYSFNGVPINGVAPRATVIPVKVLNQSGSGWSSVVARGIVYIADLKASGRLGSAPTVINMSLGGPRLDAVEKAAVDYAIARGVILVGSAGNRGTAGMSYPGAYAPVISVAASGWVGEWVGGSAFWRRDVPDPTDADDFYIADFSSRAKTGQDLDVAAPGSWVVGPYQLQSGKTSYFFLGGTSMAAPHVAGIVALMAQQNPGLSPSAAESTLESTAIRLAAGCRTVLDGPGGPSSKICWGADATGHGLATADAALGLRSGRGR
jgi:subtilisin family serine protease